jgi:hypothetical protein
LIFVHYLLRHSPGAAFFAIVPLLCAVLIAPQGTPAQDASPQVEKVSVGFGGKYKVGFWTPVRLEITAGAKPFAGQLTLEIPDSEGGPCQWTSPESAELHLAPNEKTTLVRFVKFGRLESRLTAIFQSKEGETSRIRLDEQTTAPLATTARIALQLGSDLDWSAVSQQRRSAGRETPEVISISTAEELPDSLLGYDGVDFLSITTADLTLLEQCSAAQREAMIAWVRTGGRVLLSVGKNGDAILGDTGILRALSPGKWAGVIEQSSMKSLESLVQADVRLDSVGGSRTRDFTLPLALVSDYRGRLLLDEAGPDGKPRPVAISAPCGFGQVVMIGFDLGLFPFSRNSDKPGWASTPVLLEKLEDELMGHAPKMSADQQGAGNLGYTDLAGQFQTALDRFPGVSLVPFSLLVALIVGYGLLVTVADYFFLRRVVQKMHWTWLTFPLIAILFCGLAIGVVRSLRSAQPKVRQVELVDIDVEGMRVRGRTWLHIYSPKTDAYRIAHERKDWPPLTDVQSAISWHGMPGKGVSGMDRRALTSVFDEPYSQSQPGANSAVTGLPIQYASSRRLLDEWTGRADLGNDSELKTEDGAYLRGSFVNPLNQDLDNVLLIYRTSAYRISSTVAAGKRQIVDPSDTPLNLNWLVTQRRTIETKDVSTPWDPESEDIARLMEIFTLHEAAGAESYTGLANRYYRALDLTEHAAKGQAVLYGRVKKPISAPKIVSNGSESPLESIESWTYVRILLPVTHERVNR